MSLVCSALHQESLTQKELQLFSLYLRAPEAKVTDRLVVLVISHLAEARLLFPAESLIIDIMKQKLYANIFLLIRVALV